MDSRMLENLSALLKDRKMWPANFIWGYTTFGACAMGLACQAWDIDILGIMARGRIVEQELAKMMGIDQGNFMRIFFRAGDVLGVPIWTVTPEMVAGLIDQYLEVKKYQHHLLSEFAFEGIDRVWYYTTARVHDAATPLPHATVPSLPNIEVRVFDAGSWISGIIDAPPTETELAQLLEGVE